MICNQGLFTVTFNTLILDSDKTLLCVYALIMMIPHACKESPNLPCPLSPALPSIQPSIQDRVEGRAGGRACLVIQYKRNLIIQEVCSSHAYLSIVEMPTRMEEKKEACGEFLLFSFFAN